MTWLGPDGITGTADDQQIDIDAGDAQAVVYNPSANVDVVSGLTYPTAVRQTLTLLFKNPLPAGSYRIEISPKVTTAAFNQDESTAEHPLVTHLRVGIVAGQDMNTFGIVDGARFFADNLVSAADAAVSFSAFKAGTPFLSQLQGDLASLLDQNLTEGADKNITAQLIAQIRRA